MLCDVGSKQFRKVFVTHGSGARALLDLHARQNLHSLSSATIQLVVTSDTPKQTAATAASDEVIFVQQMTNHTHKSNTQAACGLAHG